METKDFKIKHIPAVCWGTETDRVIIVVHGSMSNKRDGGIEILAEHAAVKQYQVLSFDLPEHGERKEEGIPCKIQQCVKELKMVMQYARERWKHISLYACSMGAYFSLMAYGDEKLEKAWFQSPLVDMQRMIENMMKWFQVSEQQLELEQEIATPMGQTLYWDYYCFVKEHPIAKWDVPTAILYGEMDELCERDTIDRFTERFNCELQVVPEAEHYFHTPEQTAAYEEWLCNHL